jgi:hypothetical protein
MAATGRERELPETTLKGKEEGDDDAHLLSTEQLAAIGNFHSGLAEVSVQQWAILLRCNGDKMVAVDELVSSLLDWFPTPLSAAEVSDFIDRLVGQQFLIRKTGGAGFQTTPRGAEVLSQTKVPLIKGAMWSLGTKDDEGGNYVSR